jgi:hypothetical protein
MLCGHDLMLWASLTWKNLLENLEVKPEQTNLLSRARQTGFSRAVLIKR